MEKTPLALCEVMRKCAVEQGLADLEVEFHVVTSKMHPAVVSRQNKRLEMCFSTRCLAISFSNDRMSTSGRLDHT